MTLTTFLFAAQGLMELEGLSFHVETPDRPVASPADNKARNAQAMQAWQGMMAGVEKGKRGGRR